MSEGVGERREPLSREAVGELDTLAMKIKNEISGVAGVESIDLAYRILVSCIADKVGPNSVEVARVLRTSSDAVAVLLERLPGGRMTQIHQH